MLQKVISFLVSPYGIALLVCAKTEIDALLMGNDNVKSNSTIQFVLNSIKSGINWIMGKAPAA